MLCFSRKHKNCHLTHNLNTEPHITPTCKPQTRCLCSGLLSPSDGVFIYCVTHSFVQRNFDLLVYSLAWHRLASIHVTCYVDSEIHLL